jgi:hypothetical protein
MPGKPPASTFTTMDTTSGISFFGALTILLIALKLTGVIHASWALVTLFIWLPICIWTGTIIIFVLGAFVVKATSWFVD